MFKVDWARTVVVKNEGRTVAVRRVFSKRVVVVRKAIRNKTLSVTKSVLVLLGCPLARDFDRCHHFSVAMATEAVQHLKA